LALKKKYGLTEYATTGLDVYALCRTLAKIAHGYAVLRFGLDGFKPLLPYFIMGNYDRHRLYYVGGLLDTPPEAEKLHEIDIEHPTPETWRHVVVRIRLLAKYGTPIYRVVAGERLNPIAPLEVLLARANAPHTGQRSSAGDQTSPPIPAGLWDPNAPSSREAPEPKTARYVRAAVRLSGDFVKPLGK